MFLAAWLAVVFLPRIAFAPECRATVYPGSGLVGDLYTYSAAVLVPNEVRVVQPDFSLLLAGLTIESVKASTRISFGRRIVTYKVGFTAYAPGSHEIPPLMVTLTQDGRENSFIMSPAVKVHVKSVSADQPKGTYEISITDHEGSGAGRKIDTAILFRIKETLVPLTVMTNRKLFTALWIVLGMLITVVLFYAIRFIMRPKPVLRSAAELAIERLDALEKSDMLAKGEYRDFYAELVQIIAGHIRHLCGKGDVQLMTSDLITIVTESERLPDEIRIDLISVLRAADKARFANSAPQESEIVRSLQAVKHMLKPVKENMAKVAA